MMKLVNTLILCCALLWGSCSFAQHTIIPKPQHLKVSAGHYQLNTPIQIEKDKRVPELDYFVKRLKNIVSQDIKLVKRRADITTSYIHPKPENNEGYYELTIDENGVDIAAPTNKGLFYGLQTLLQIIDEHKADLQLPYLEIKDQPKFAYRGMHLDVCRHFFTTEEVMNYLDYMATFKLNKFHWHLTDDQGWRIEIKKYPKLTEVGAWRSGSMVGHYTDNNFDNKRYGGFYTQEDIKKVVAYAKKLHIDVIPEIEMPGHAQAAIAAYPELGCTKDSVEVWKRWGISDVIFEPSEKTFHFLEGVIDEVVELFPYKYIHVGGDEAHKTQWEESDFVQNLMKEKGFETEEEVQSYFITRMEKYINSKGKEIIGWDEILQGGLAPNATVMSWRGEAGGIKAAKSHHKVIMTPNTYNYFDYYQGNPKSEPLAIGGYLPLERVYSYNPIPEGISPEQEQYIWGTQANLWTEYIPTFDKVEYMIFPRMMALSEVAWGTNEPEHYKNFENRVIAHFPTLERRGIDYSPAVFEVKGKISKENGQLYYALSNSQGTTQIHYTTDGSDPTVDSPVYQYPLPIMKSQTVKAAYFDKEKRLSHITIQDFKVSKSTGKAIQLETPASRGYNDGGALSLVNGIYGNPENHGRNWLGFQGKDMVATIDFGRQTKFNNVKFTVLDRNGSWIYLPKKIVVSVSDDGKSFKTLKTLDQQDIKSAKGKIDLNLGTQHAHYLKVTAQTIGNIPEGRGGAGHPAYIFIDEIAVF